MRIAVVSDVHANWPALQAVLADLDQVDDTICLGDLIGYGGQPLACLDHVRDRGWLTLTGNHDRACTDADVLDWFNLEAAAVVRWTAAQLDQERTRWLRELPERATRDGALLVHASPRDPVYEYVLDDRTAAANLRLMGDHVCFHGHTHLPGVYRFDEDGRVVHDYCLGRLPLCGPALVNPGSVGQPRDRDPDASYGVWDTDADTIEFRRVPYDREAAKRAILEAGLPRRFATRLDFGY
jgi:diadenosine tetraphosphatase ApaH/serine/threonine PP2A family protein phosphatase